MAFPISRVRGILKADEDNKLLAKDVLFYFEKATVNKITHTQFKNSYLLRKLISATIENFLLALKTATFLRNCSVHTLLSGVLSICSRMEGRNCKLLIFVNKIFPMHTFSLELSFLAVI